MRACVVGAGPAGLVATKTLRESGVDAVAHEVSTEIGGTWVFDNPNGRSAAYRSLETNTTPAMSRLSDFEMPPDWPDFPGHARLREWWGSYADRFSLHGALRLGCEVVSARPRDPSGWIVRTRNVQDETEREESYDALLACSGSYWDPRWPEIEGSFAGDFLHARQYRDPETPVHMRDRRVVVIGIGNTGCELACEIAASGARSVRLAARSGVWVMPKTHEGKPVADSAPMLHPLDPVPAPFRVLPAPVRERLFARLGRVAFHRRFGERMQRLEAVGLPKPPDDPLAKRATVCDPLPEALETGQLEMRPAVSRFDGRRLTFSDGRMEEADVVLCATGYHLRYPYLPETLFDPVRGDADVFQGTLHATRHDLFFVGVSRPTGAFWPIAEVHAQFVAALLAGRYRLPRAGTVRRRSRPMLARRSFNPALYGLAVREELTRGARRARRLARS